MIPTQSFIEERFQVFNRQMFGGKLPPVAICMSNAKTFLGKCTYRKRRTWYGKVEYYDFRLRINTRIDLPEQEVEDILLHEMIHYYIAVNRLSDRSSHGPRFRQMMDDINRQHHRHITISFRGTATQREQLLDQRRVWRIVAVVRFRDGRKGIKVLPRVVASIVRYCHHVRTVSDVTDVILYASDDIFFSRYPRSSALKVHYIDADELQTHLDGARSLVIEGDTIRIQGQ